MPLTAGEAPEKTYQIQLNDIKVVLKAGTMELLTIFVLLCLLATAIFFMVFARRRAKSATLANRRLQTQIFERERAEAAARESQRLLQAVAYNSPAVIYIKDREGHYLLINRRFEELFHLTADNMAGKTDYDLFPKEIADALRRVDQSVMEAEKALEAEELVPLEDELHTFFSVKAPLRDAAGNFYAICGVSTDITVRKRAEEALRESEERTRAIVDTALDGIIAMDREGRIVEFNSAAEAVFGHPRAAVMGRPLSDVIIPPGLREKHIEGLARFHATGEAPVLGRRLELAGMRADGTNFPIELSITRMPGKSSAMFTGFIRDITAEREATKAAKESWEQYRALAESIPHLIWTSNPGGECDYLSRQWFEYTGKPVAEQLSLGWAESIHPEDREHARRSWAEAVASGKTLDFKFRIRRADGAYRWFRSIAVPMRDEAGHIVKWFGTNSDFEDYSKTQERLQAQLGWLSLLDQITRSIGERLDLGSVFQVVLRTLEDNLPTDFGCVCLYDPATKMLTVSRSQAGDEALASRIGLIKNTKFAIGQTGLAHCVEGHLVYEHDTRGSTLFLSKLLAEAGLYSVVLAPLLSESQVFGVLVAGRRRPNGFVSGECEFLRQLSEHVALAAHQAEMYAALQQAYDDLRRTQESVMEQERLRTLGQMASGIAHDINNALSPVALYTESLLEHEQGLNARTREYLETTQRAVSDVAQTVGRMREFYRRRETQLVLAAVDVNAVTRQVLDLTRARWSDMPQQRGIVIDLHTELAPDLPPMAGIESEIREALTNLIFNAVDAMPDGGTLTLRTLLGEVTKSGVPERVQVEVTDTGIGMDEETRRRCLEPFFSTKGERGTGLGLAMVYGIAQRHNAELSLESAVGRGTTVRLSLPVHVSLSGGDSSGSSDRHTPAERLKVLTVDDDPLILKSLRAALEAEGHSVTTATGGREGIDALQAAAERNDPFALVITDLGMPYVDGRKVASAAKMACRTTPVILLTGWGQRLAAEEDIPPNVDRVLDKPPRLQQLRAALAELVPGDGNSNTPVGHQDPSSLSNQQLRFTGASD